MPLFPSEKINLKLSKSEALVLFEFVSRLSELEDSELEKIIHDPSEKAIIWSVEALLERELAEPFYQNYTELVEEARRELKGQYGL